MLDIGRIERYVYEQKRSNEKLKAGLGTGSFFDITHSQKKLPADERIIFYEKSIDILFNYKIDKNIKKSIANMIYNFFEQIHVDRKELKNLERYLKNMDVKKCDIPNWKAISTFFMSNGMFHMAFIAREKYKESLFSTRGRVYCWERCKAHLENGNIDMAKKEIKRIETSIGMRSAYTMGIPIAKKFIQLLTNSPQSIKDNRDSTSAADKEFFKLLEGKKVVIEGPAPEIERLESTDNLIYVRNNDFFERSERKTDITYLNYDTFKLYREKYKRYDNNWKFICFKAIDSDFRLSEHMRMVSNPSRIFLFGGANMLPIMLFDLAGENIFVTGNNLMITAIIHNEEYEKKNEIEYVRENNVKLCYSLAAHDAISQYFFLEKLYASKLFKADKQLSNVLNMGVEKYCETMDEVHGIASKI